jgi:chromosome segregation protein
VRLTSVTLQGFKSFANRTTIEFSQRVTAIVGPNGSGKSNVLEALKWTTGGGRARAFRADDKTDLIFHGAAGKRSLGFAEVEVELSDGRRSLSIRRDLGRDGASRLRLNGKAARFIDVDEALAGSGLGTSGVAIIGQGEVSGVLMADPEDLLQYVAEAAGVARLRSRREQTMARLQTARGHLSRLEDVMVELREQVEYLRAEAADAERHRALSREALRLRVTAAGARVAALREEVADLTAREGRQETAIDAAGAEIDAARTTVAATRSRLAAAEARYREAMAEAEQKRGEANLAAAERDRALERLQALEQRAGEVDDELERLGAVEAPTRPDGDDEALEQAAAAAEARLDAANRAAIAAEERTRTEAATLDAARRAASDSERAWAAFHAREASLREQLDAARAYLGELASEAPVDVAVLERTAAAAERDAAEGESTLDTARAVLVELQAAHADANAEAQARARAVERQRAALSARQGYAQGPKHALTSGIPGVIGSVADLVQVPERYQSAIAGALGRRGEYVVVDSAATAERVLDHVRRAGGWVTVLPLDLLRGGRPAPWSAGQGADGVHGLAIDLVDTDARYRVVVEQLLGDTVVVESLGHATRLAREHRHRPRLVTLDGDTVDPGGAMTGGRRSFGASVLGAARDLEEAEAAAEAARATAEAALTRLEQAQAAAHAAREAAVAAREHAARASGALATARESLQSEARLRREGEDRIERLSAALASLETPEGMPLPQAVQAAVRAAEEAFRSSESARQAADTERLEAERAASGAREARAVFGERQRAYDAARARYEEARARVEELREARGGLQERVLQAREQREIAAERARAAEAAVPTDLGAVVEAFEAARSAASAADARLDALTRQQAELGRALEETRITLARREAALELAQEEQAALPDGVEPLELGERAARARLREVEEALEAIGPVNHRAGQDHAARAERLETLEVEAVQATLAVTDLEGTLDRIDRETTAALTTSIDGLRVGFREHVRSLFGDDAVGEIDVDQDGARPVGLRIRLQPPGKQTQSLGLLSVGERTMGALAFLFALMAPEEGRLPIAVLDEVDAPLDEANIRRFGEYLETLSGRGTQFVLITHQKATFEVADTLWGVTTEGGVSRVFSIRRDGRQEALFFAQNDVLPPVT